MPTRRALLAILLFAPSAAAARSGWTRTAFRRANPCPATGAIDGPCPGYVVDHDQPLCAGGEDAPANMRWQEATEAAEKDRLEHAVCRAMRE